jgi:hypothetical protein
MSKIAATLMMSLVEGNTGIKILIEWMVVETLGFLWLSNEKRFLGPHKFEGKNMAFKGDGDDGRQMAGERTYHC